MEQVVTGQLPHMLAQPVVILAHGTLQPGACGKREPMTPQTKGIPLGRLPFRGQLKPRGRREALSYVPGVRGNTDKASPPSQPWVQQKSPRESVVESKEAGRPGSHTYVLLSDRDSREGLDFLFVCGRGARVFKLIEKLKDKRPEGRSLVGGRGPSPRWALKCKAGLPAKAPRLCLSWSPDPPLGVRGQSPLRGPAMGSCLLFCFSQCHLEARAGGQGPEDSRALPGLRVPPMGSCSPVRHQGIRTRGPVPSQTKYSNQSLVNGPEVDIIPASQVSLRSQ